VQGRERDEERDEAESHGEGAKEKDAAGVGAEWVAEQHLVILRQKDGVGGFGMGCLAFAVNLTQYE
jgi:hypothetical protein